MLLDPETYAAAPGVERLLGPPGLKTELFSCLVETNTAVCETAAEALAELRRLREVVRDSAAREGLVVAATGSHPFSRPEEQEIVREPRYLALLEERPAARSQLVCGLHVHVGMTSFARCLETLEFVLPWLPAVLAVSLNSPYLAGENSGRAVGARRPAPRAAAGGRAAAPGAGGLDGGGRAGRRRLHADLVGRAPASPARDARGADAGPADERPAIGCARRARAGAVRLGDAWASRRSRRVHGGSGGCGRRPRAGR